jgi:hypothetical protein
MAICTQEIGQTERCQKGPEVDVCRKTVTEWDVDGENEICRVMGVTSACTDQRMISHMTKDAWLCRKCGAGALFGDRLQSMPDSADRLELSRIEVETLGYSTIMVEEVKIFSRLMSRIELELDVSPR